ncbi:MAG TPA: hypothetical protein VMU32_09400 [Solirubrobacteraceae bacterium]|jgi:hypothetical protein|nr:hypothetical protein [Solirubrobacteraceae bacterium]
MSIERIFLCDCRECDGHMRTASTSASPFITVTEGAGRSLHFCDWDCVLKHAAAKPPVETIPLATAE